MVMVIKGDGRNESPNSHQSSLAGIWVETCDEVWGKWMKWYIDDDGNVYLWMPATRCAWAAWCAAAAAACWCAGSSSTPPGMTPLPPRASSCCASDACERDRAGEIAPGNDHDNVRKLEIRFSWSPITWQGSLHAQILLASLFLWVIKRGMENELTISERAIDSHAIDSSVDCSFSCT